MKTQDTVDNFPTNNSGRNYVLGIYILFITTTTLGYAAVTAWQTL